MTNVLEGVDIDNLEAGQEIDTLIAEKVLGWEREGDCWRTTDNRYWPVEDREGEYEMWPQTGFHPSRDIDAAWQVVEHLRGQRIYLIIEAFADYWEARYCDSAVQDEPVYSGLGATAPLAVCRAALKVVQP